MSLITSHPLFKTLKPTLDSITSESTNVTEYAYGKIVTGSKMKHGYSEHLEVAGTTFLVEKPQGATTVDEKIILGKTVRIFPKTFAKKVIITMEALDDCQFVDDVLKPAKRLQASAKKTRDIDCAGLIINSTNTAVTGGYDGLTLANASHALTAGGTQSNIASVYATPSIQALMLMRAALGQMKGPNGLLDPRVAKKLVCSLIQEDVWKTILGTEKVTGSNFNDINIVREYKLDLVAIPWLDASSQTQWGAITDAEEGLMCEEKGKIDKSTWVDNDRDVINYKVKYRLGLGWANWRAWYQGNV